MKDERGSRERSGNRGRVKQEGQQAQRKVAYTMDRKYGTKAKNWATGGRKLKEEKQNKRKRKRCTADRK